jgi:hypothetical protein
MEASSEFLKTLRAQTTDAEVDRVEDAMKKAEEILSNPELRKLNARLREYNAVATDAARKLIEVEALIEESKKREEKRKKLQAATVIAIQKLAKEAAERIPMQYGLQRATEDMAEKNSAIRSAFRSLQAGELLLDDDVEDDDRTQRLTDALVSSASGTGSKRSFRRFADTTPSININLLTDKPVSARVVGSRKASGRATSGRGATGRNASGRFVSKGSNRLRLT